MEKLQIYLKESYDELVKNVTWPTWASLQGNAIAVIIAALILALLVFVMDVAAKTALDLIYGTGN
jgi:preprotein translocase subunit SecE